MKFVIQRVRHASVTVEGEVIGKIGRGYMVLIGACDADDEAIADKMVDKMIKLRINRDAEGKTNLSLADVDGGLLLISQFTLYANCNKGNRPTFNGAGNPALANEFYEYIIAECKTEIPVVQTGKFGADMQVSLVNDGPFTIMLE
jgi:D-tyrosyl-tRNA(Tyr) deacylase